MDDKLKDIENIVKNTNENSVLARLWRTILSDLRMTNALSFLINRYLNSDKNESRAIKRKNKSTLITNITTENMTWKVFLDLVLNLLKVKAFDLTITLHHYNGDKTVHTIHVDNTKGKDDGKQGKTDSKQSN